MRIAVILNKDGDTLKTEDLDRFSPVLRDAFEGAGHEVNIQIILGTALLDTLELRRTILPLMRSSLAAATALYRRLQALHFAAVKRWAFCLLEP